MAKKNGDVVLGQKLFALMQLWNEGITDVRRGYLKMGKAIHILKKDRLWLKDCAGIPSFKYYVTHELKISVAQAHRLDQIYRLVGDIIEKNNIDINIDKITLLLPYLKGLNDDEKAEILNENKDLSFEAIKNNLLETNGQGHKATDVCPHFPYELESWSRCPNCGKFIKMADLCNKLGYKPSKMWGAKFKDLLK